MRSQMYLPQLGKINKILIIVTVASFLVGAIFQKVSGAYLGSIFGLSAMKISQGHIYQFLTYPFFPHSIMEVIFNALIFWFIGSDLEQMWGRKRYLSFLITTLLGAGIIFVALQFIFFSNSIIYAVPLTGVAGLAGTLCMAYGILFPNRTMYFFFFPLQAKWFVILLIGMSLYQGVFSPGGILAWGQLGAYLSGFVWMNVISSPRFKKFMKSGSEREAQKRAQRVQKSHLKLVDEEDDDNDVTYH